MFLTTFLQLIDMIFHKLLGEGKELKVIESFSKGRDKTNIPGEP